MFTHHTMYHEYVHYLPGARTVLREMMLRYVGNYCRRADMIITPTPQIRDFAVKTYGLWHKPVKAIPTGITTDEFRRGDAAGCDIVFHSRRCAGARIRRATRTGEKRPFLLQNVSAY